MPMTRSRMFRRWDLVRRVVRKLSSGRIDAEQTDVVALMVKPPQSQG